jgi:deoxyadenosine/deoxycytidine kinase
MKIVSIQGPWSVGKSTLLGNLQKCSRLDIFTMKEFGDCERSERDKYNFDLSVKEDFVKNQEVFFKGELARHHRIQSLSNAYIALDRGPEDTICFSTIHPKAIKAKWDIATELTSMVREYINYQSDLIVYLYADIEILRQRKIRDSEKRRSNFDYYLDLYYEYELDYFKNDSRTVFINTTDMTTESVFAKVMDLLI